MEDDGQFFKDATMFDVELDAEISVETMTLKKERITKVEEIARQTAKKKKKRISRDGKTHMASLSRKLNPKLNSEIQSKHE
ncbi:hypothetical protein LIER_33027 [Lithospermum erythrorhizon]|uniref:Uncharacterized protein n=1 Tax=Lithospermum erythrorhizon TaxID=34254 RepID=A0AAV3RWF8_LITER